MCAHTEEGWWQEARESERARERARESERERERARESARERERARESERERERARESERERERPVEGHSHGLRHLFQIFQLRVHSAVLKAAQRCQKRHPYSRAPELWHLSCPCACMRVHMACMHVCVHARMSMAVYTSLSLSRARARALPNLALSHRTSERASVEERIPYLGDLRCLVMIIAEMPPRCHH